MKRVDAVPKATGDVDALCGEIRREAEAERSRILDEARRQSDDIVRTAQERARARAERARAEASLASERMRDRILSVAGLEERRAVLQERMAFADEVLAEVRRAAERFRRCPDYRRFLISSVERGAALVGAGAVVVVAPGDWPTVDESFRREAREACGRSGGDVQFLQGEFDGAGVIVRSADGRVVCDCRIESLLAAARDGLVAEFLKGDS